MQQLADNDNIINANNNEQHNKHYNEHNDYNCTDNKGCYINNTAINAIIFIKLPISNAIAVLSLLVVTTSSSSVSRPTIRPGYQLHTPFLIFKSTNVTMNYVQSKPIYYVDDHVVRR